VSGRLWLCVVALAAAAVLAGCSGASVGGYLDDTYRLVSTEAGDSRLYASSAPPAATAAQIAARHRPIDHVSSTSGEFLRYDDVIVGVTASGAGSQIYLDDTDRGYRRWAAFVGPTWARPIGQGEGFRGGGPGDGK
jgi:hypothetical protein